MIQLKFSQVHGVDFSGAKLAGENIWIASAVPLRGALKLTGLHRLRSLCGTADRAPALAHLVDLVARSANALWGMDYPLGCRSNFSPPVRVGSDNFNS